MNSVVFRPEIHLYFIITLKQLLVIPGKKQQDYASISQPDIFTRLERTKLDYIGAMKASSRIQK